MAQPWRCECWIALGELYRLGRILGQPLEDWAYTWMWEFTDSEGSWNWFAESEDDVPESLEDFELTLRFPVEAGAEYGVSDGNYRGLTTIRSINSG